MVCALTCSFNVAKSNAVGSINANNRPRTYRCSAQTALCVDVPAIRNGPTAIGCFCGPVTAPDSHVRVYCTCAVFRRRVATNPASQWQYTLAYCNDSTVGGRRRKLTAV